MLDLYLIESEKGRPLVVCESYFYVVKRVCKKHVVWRCSYNHCLAMAVSGIDFEKNITTFWPLIEHDHLPELEEAIRKIYFHKMKCILRESLISSREVFSRVLTGANMTILKAIGNPENFYKNLRNFKNKLMNPGPILYNTLRLGESITTTFRGTPFYQYGPDRYRNLAIKDKILLFFSNEMFEKLKIADVLCIDGTFNVVPYPYYQLFTISYLDGVHVIPVIFAILKDKTQETYEDLLDLIINLNGNLNPVVIKTDFEYASMKAFSKKFPNSKISGCQFHLGQCLIRKIKDHLLYSAYMKDKNLKKYIRALVGLSYVNPEFIESTFEELQEDSHFPVDLKSIYIYFYENFIKNGSNARFSYKIWNISGQVEDMIPKTNNGIEGWHNVFASTFGSSRYN